ncbi:Hypothetical_protein [Hexamita inflata]|uniref:Hypothetical_protein n=1 Tax=Hexamita inflata TaxID=28002 RepID=A0AA86UZU7_9EUKA|nr:Hypothetical protein HINF_LOCUS66600 [Hexamita inflata]
MSVEHFKALFGQIPPQKDEFAHAPTYSRLQFDIPSGPSTHSYLGHQEPIHNAKKINNTSRTTMINNYTENITTCVQYTIAHKKFHRPLKNKIEPVVKLLDHSYENKIGPGTYDVQKSNKYFQTEKSAFIPKETRNVLKEKKIHRGKEASEELRKKLALPWRVW